ncbi:hypothetical protein K432DRAFT_383076 [Lepidopterella palustris CBS 459.81]|uniref:Prokaryotic-type class I peptide chain release factors domain-containing protein n=1 Tax=Lepidopterella palustris CBS 459.81 TaxID=1314670 RepID=A0A8E2E9B0_9PEZI|nr:hypothetical protein K432DRAFT_383076 [Lepidopterella palustris CBS 459.81]
MPFSSLLRPLFRPPTSNGLTRSLRSFSSTLPCYDKPLPPRRIIPETEIIENFLRGSGPGGQKINKTSSAVQLKHIPTGVVVKSQDTRSRTQNRKIARRLLGEKLDEMELGEMSRTGLKAKIKIKRKASSVKKSRRKYRALAEGKEGGEEEGEDGDRAEDSDLMRVDELKPGDPIVEGDGKKG